MKVELQELVKSLLLEKRVRIHGSRWFWVTEVEMGFGDRYGQWLVKGDDYDHWLDPQDDIEFEDKGDQK